MLDMLEKHGKWKLPYLCEVPVPILYINVDGWLIVSISRVVSIKVAEPHHFNVDPDPDQAFHLNADPDTSFKNNADPDPQPWLALFFADPW